MNNQELIKSTREQYAQLSNNEERLSVWAIELFKAGFSIEEIKTLDKNELNGSFVEFLIYNKRRQEENMDRESFVKFLDKR